MMREASTYEEFERRQQEAMKGFVADEDAVQAAHDRGEDWEKSCIYSHAMRVSAGLFIKPSNFNGVISGPIDEMYSDLVGSQFSEDELNRIAADREGDKIKSARNSGAECERERQEEAFLSEALSWTGEHYTPDLEPKEVCAIIRQCIKQGVKDGVLPTPADYRVTSGKERWYADREYVVRTYHDDSVTADLLHKLLLPYQKCSVSCRNEYGNPSMDENYSYRIGVMQPIPAEAKRLRKDRVKSGENRMPIEEFMVMLEKLNTEEMLKRGFFEAQIVAGFSSYSEDDKRELTEYVKEKAACTL